MQDKAMTTNQTTRTVDTHWCRNCAVVHSECDCITPDLVAAARNARIPFITPLAELAEKCGMTLQEAVQLHAEGMKFIAESDAAGYVSQDNEQAHWAARSDESPYGTIRRTYGEDANL